MADTTLPGLLATGDHASRPAASAVGSGGLYSCTDHSLVYQTDGSSWTTWATLGGDVSAHTGDTSDAHDASAISVLDTAANFTGTDVEAVLAELQDNIDGVSGGSTLAAAVSRQVSGTDYTTTSGTYADIDGTNLSLTMTTGAHRVKVTLACVLNHSSTSNTTNFDVLVDGSSDTGLGNGAWQFRSHAGGNLSVTFTYITTALTAASHTIKVQWKTNGGTATMARNGFATTFAVEELPV